MAHNQIFDDILKETNSKKKTNDNLLDKLFEKPKKDKGIEATTFSHVAEGYYQQADLLFLPNDRGYQYCLVVVDQGSRKVDAVALKSKNSNEILQAFKKIYNNNILDKPQILRTDSGSEFKNDVVINGLDKMGITLSFAKAGRHRQVALVERKNQTIGKVIHKIILHDTLSSGNDSSAWVEILPKIVKAINNRVVESNKKTTKPKSYANPKLELIDIGQKVRVMLDNPRDITGAKLTGRFRSADIRWDPKERTIINVLLKPDQPPMYQLDGENIGYTRNQLQLISRNETKPQQTITNPKNLENRYEVKSIISHKTVKGKRQYLIWWKNYPKKEATWEPEDELMKDIPQKLAIYKRVNNL